MYDPPSIRRYQEADVNSMGKEKMIILLYEKMITCFQQAEKALERDDRVAMASRVNLAQRIVTELRNALDHEIGGEIAANLESIYDYVFHENLQLLVDRDPTHLRNSISTLEPLLAAWRQIPPGTADRETRERAGETSPKGPDPAGQPVGAAPPEDPGSSEPRPDAEPAESGLLCTSA